MATARPRRDGRGGLARFDKSLEGIDADLPLLGQHGAVALGLRSATDAVLVACGSVPAYAAVSSALRRGAVATAVTAARARTRELAEADWMKGSRSSGQRLELGPFVDEARAAIDAVEADRPLWFERVKLQDALRAVVDTVALVTTLPAE